MADLDPARIPELDARLSTLAPVDRLRWAYETFGARAGIGTSFQPAGVVILHLAKTAGLPIQAFTLNTGLLFPETLEFKAKLEAHLGINVEEVLPAQTVEQQAAQYGAELWKRDPEKCCELRKVDSLGKKLFDLDLWITGMRREQSTNRGTVEFTEQDDKGRAKFNPLADWSWADVWHYIQQHGVPYNPLHDQFMPSIGCAPCTRAIAVGEDFRAGRWWWEDEAAKECGLHVKK